MTEREVMIRAEGLRKRYGALEVLRGVSLEVARGVEAANDTYAGKWAGKKYSEVPDSLFNVSDSDLRAYYNSHKDLFRQLPSRTISYVVFEVAPTAA